MSAARALASEGYSVSAFDAKEEAAFDAQQVGELRRLGVKLKFGLSEPRILDGTQTLVLSPGIDPQTPWVQDAATRGVRVTNEATLALEQLALPVIAITGSSGKTTTTTLIGELLKALGCKPFVGGNIGYPLIELVRDPQDYDIVVAELSSFQLELAEGFVPEVTVFTNFVEDHLDRYGSIEAYFAAKARLAALGDATTSHVVYWDNAWLRKLRDVARSGRLLPFALESSFGGDGAIGAPGSSRFQVMLSGRQATFTTEKSQMLGSHNLRNWMAAVLAVSAHFERDVGEERREPLGLEFVEKTQQCIDTFPGIPHRTEWVATRKGVRYYNDSKATNLAALQSSLALFDEGSVVLIAGGREKGLSFEMLADEIRRKCATVCVYGEARQRLSEAWAQANPTVHATLDDAFHAAVAASKPGRVVLLSPACSSLDAFRNFEERGNRFKALVKALES